MERDINLTASEISKFVTAGARKGCFPLGRDTALLPYGELCAFLLVLVCPEDNTRDLILIWPQRRTAVWQSTSHQIWAVIAMIQKSQESCDQASVPILHS